MHTANVRLTPRQEPAISASSGAGTTYQTGEDSATRMLLKYATIIVSVVPIICVYIPLQKYFTKGIMIGALKG